jgi:hypothetical protein
MFWQTRLPPENHATLGIRFSIPSKQATGVEGIPQRAPDFGVSITILVTLQPPEVGIG